MAAVIPNAPTGLLNAVPNTPVWLQNGRNKRPYGLLPKPNAPLLGDARQRTKHTPLRLRSEVAVIASAAVAAVGGSEMEKDEVVRVASAVEEVVCWWCRCDGGSEVGPQWRRVASSGVDEGGVRVEPRTIDDDQINSNIQFDSIKGNVNSGSVEKDTHVYDLCVLDTLAWNAYDEAAKQQRFAQKVQQQNMTLTTDERAKRVQKQAESQLYRDRDIIRDLEKQRDKLSQEVKPLLNKLLDHFDGFQNLFQRDIKEMKDAFEQNDVYLDEIERQNDLLKD
ncbi:hypothetical protein Tco_0903864 [Tanacetum coccineum]